MNWYVLKSPALSLSVRNALETAGLEHFLPTQEVLQNVGGVKRRIEKPIALNFVFVYGDIERIKAFVARELKFRLHLVYKHRAIDTGTAEPLIVPDLEMKLFAQTVGAYKDKSVPFINPSEVDLEEGDLVRIIGGQFDGVEGVLISQKGKDGGRVMVSVSNLLSVPTLHIEPEYLQVLKYGKSNKHFYRHIETYTLRLEHCLQGDADVSPIQVFVRRYSELRVETLNAEAKLVALLMASFKVLGDEERYAQYRERLEAMLPKIKSEKTLEFVKRYF